MLLREEGKGQLFYWWDVAVGSWRLGYTKVRGMKEGKIPTSNQCTFSSYRDGCAQAEEISTATQLASLVCWERQIGDGNIWKHCPLQRASTLLTQPRLKACCERWCHTLTSPTPPCIASSILNVSGIVQRNYLPVIDIIHRQRRIWVRIIWSQTINAVMIFCSGFGQAPVSEEFLIQDWGLQIIRMCAGWLPAAAQQLFSR